MVRHDGLLQNVSRFIMPDLRRMVEIRLCPDDFCLPSLFFQLPEGIGKGTGQNVRYLGRGYHHTDMTSFSFWASTSSIFLVYLSVSF